MVDDGSFCKNLCRVPSYMFDRVLNSPLKSVIISNIELIILLILIVVFYFKFKKNQIDITDQN